MDLSKLFPQLGNQFPFFSWALTTKAANHVAKRQSQKRRSTHKWHFDFAHFLIDDRQQQLVLAEVHILMINKSYQKQGSIQKCAPFCSIGRRASPKRNQKIFARLWHTWNTWTKRTKQGRKRHSWARLWLPSIVSASMEQPNANFGALNKRLVEHTRVWVAHFSLMKWPPLD